MLDALNIHQYSNDYLYRSGVIGTRKKLDPNIISAYKAFVEMDKKTEDDMQTPLKDAPRTKVMNKSSIFQNSQDHNGILKDALIKLVPKNYMQGVFDMGFFHQFVRAGLLEFLVQKPNGSAILQEYIQFQIYKAFEIKSMILRSVDDYQFFTLNIVANEAYDIFFVELSFKDLSRSSYGSFSSYFSKVLKKCEGMTVETNEDEDGSFSFVFCFHNTYNFFQEIQVALSQTGYKDHNISSKISMDYERKVKFVFRTLYDYVLKDMLKDYRSSGISSGLFFELKEVLFRLLWVSEEVTVHSNLTDYLSKIKTRIFEESCLLSAFIVSSVSKNDLSPQRRNSFYLPQQEEAVNPYNFKRVSLDVSSGGTIAGSFPEKFIRPHQQAGLNMYLSQQVESNPYPSQQVESNPYPSQQVEPNDFLGNSGWEWKNFEADLNQVKTNQDEHTITITRGSKFQGNTPNFDDPFEF